MHKLIDESEYYTKKTENYVYQILISSLDGCRLLLGYVRDDEEKKNN